MHGYSSVQSVLNFAFLFGGSNFTFLQLGAAMMEVISRYAIYAENRTKVPTSRSIAFTLWHCEHSI